MNKTYQQMNKTVEEAGQAAEKMNYIADNMILAGYALVGSLAFYAVTSLMKQYIIQPFLSTYRFLSNQTKNMAEELKNKYGNGLVVITGATDGLGPFYANYFATLGFSNMLLIAKEN